MAIYIDPIQIDDIDNIGSEVFKYLIRKHKSKVIKMNKMFNYYIGNHDILHDNTDDKEKIRVYSNYAKYTVDVAQGYYLGDPITYNSKEVRDTLSNSVRATIRNGSVERVDDANISDIDISRLQECYDNQTIAECDSTIGKFIGIFGEAYELEYASSDDISEPRTAVYDPRNVIMVRDNTVEHNKLFAIVYEIVEDFNDVKYYHCTVYTDHNSKEYKSTDLETFIFKSVRDSEKEHFFGEVPIVEYQNNDERQGDFEQVIPLIDGLNELLSDRVTDKKKFVNSILAMFGITIDDDDLKMVKDEKYLDGIPTDARIEYIQKTFDESSMQVLCNDIIREIHKMTLTVDMTDSSFAGNSSGQALMLKLMTMNMLVKNKMRSFEKGLKKRFEMYNYWLALKGEMNIVQKNDIDIIFSVAMPIDKAEIVSMIVSLKDIVDTKTLISQLWFVNDAESVIEAVKQERAEAQAEYLVQMEQVRTLNQSFDTDDNYSDVSDGDTDGAYEATDGIDNQILDDENERRRNDDNEQ